VVDGARVVALAERLDSLAFNDKLAVLRWLKELFELCAEVGLPVLNCDEVASHIGSECELLPDPFLPVMAPLVASDRQVWALKLAINTLIMPPESAAARYGIVAFAIDMVINDVEG
jgi:hypothetical protein